MPKFKVLLNRSFCYEVEVEAPTASEAGDIAIGEVEDELHNPVNQAQAEAEVVSSKEITDED